MQNQKVWATLSLLSLIVSLSTVVLLFKSTRHDKPSVSITDSSCSAKDLSEIKMKIIARHTFDQSLGFSEGIYSITEDDLNNNCVPENFKREYKIAKECYFSNKGCSQSGFFEELRKFLEIPIMGNTN